MLKENVSIRPQDIALPSYKGILKGELNLVPHIMHQNAIIKAIHAINVQKKKFCFVLLTEINAHLQDSELKDLIPNDLSPDIPILKNRGLVLQSTKGVMLSEFTKLSLYTQYAVN